MATDVLIKEVETDAVLSPLYNIVVECRRVPAVAAFSLIGLLPQRSSPDWLAQAVPRRGARAAVVDSCVVVGVGCGRVDALIVAI